jgi:hypothetical protein
VSRVDAALLGSSAELVLALVLMLLLTVGGRRADSADSAAAPADPPAYEAADVNEPMPA